MDWKFNMVSPTLNSFLSEAKTLLDQLPRNHVEACFWLERICPCFSDIVKRMPSGKCWGYRMFRAQSRGFPAEVLLLIEPLQSQPGARLVYLVARRAHAEFILENNETCWFWFPPVQIQARIAFTSDQSMVSVATPEIHVPETAPLFMHPYVGTPEADYFAKVEILNDDGYKVEVALSDEAKKMFKDRLNANGVPRMRNICLPSQGRRIAEMKGRVSADIRRTQRIDIFDMVQGLWQLARQGLCRGHEENQDHPRLPLDATQMPYPICNKRMLAGSELAKRVFRYLPKQNQGSRG